MEPMTTRQCLNRRFFRGLLALIVMAFVFGVWQQEMPGVPATGAELKTLGLAVFAGMLWYRWQTPCVSCRQALGWFALLWRPAQDPFKSPGCPHCGVSIDREAPGSPI
jgi:hypothetical protein